MTPPFGISPAGGLPAPLPGEEAAVNLVSSRKIDLAGRYELDGAGNFLAMPDLHQRVTLLIAYNVRVPDIIGPSFAASVSSEVRRALEPLTRTRPPVAVIKAIDVEAGAGTAFVTVRFTDGQRVAVPIHGTSGT